MAGREIAVKKYVVRLTDDERQRLNELITKGKSPAKQQLKARILLKADVSDSGEGWSDSQIINALDTSPSMVYRVRQQLVEEGVEAKLIALACSSPPEGRSRWTLELLAEKVVELNIVDHTSDNTVGRTLKKTALSRISRSNG